MMTRIAGMGIILLMLVAAPLGAQTSGVKKPSSSKGPAMRSTPNSSPKAKKPPAKTAKGKKSPAKSVEQDIQEQLDRQMAAHESRKQAAVSAAQKQEEDKRLEQKQSELQRQIDLKDLQELQLAKAKREQNERLRKDQGTPISKTEEMERDEALKKEITIRKRLDLGPIQSEIKALKWQLEAANRATRQFQENRASVGRFGEESFGLKPGSRFQPGPGAQPNRVSDGGGYRNNMDTMETKYKRAAEEIADKLSDAETRLSEKQRRLEQEYGTRIP